MPDFFGVYEDMLVWEYLDFFGRCYRLSAAARAAMVDELLELVDLTAKRNADVDDLSRGMKQRLCLAHALVHDPEILLLDEPASGLDPRARVEIRELLLELRAMGKTIVISSHILAELAEMCDQVGIMEHGQLVASGPLDDIERTIKPQHVLRLRILSDVQVAAAVLSRLDGVGVHAVPEGDPPAWITIETNGDEQERAAVLKSLVDAGVLVAAAVPIERDLEDLFLRATTGAIK
jgi:ABC-2 type transport system ATP-binding protein